MRAYVTSIGEPTTGLCVWSLERLGIETVLIKDEEGRPTSLAEKLKVIYEQADDNFLRVDADVVANSNIVELYQQEEFLWYQALCFGWFSQDIIHGGVQFIRKEAIGILRANIDPALSMDRPETFLSRLPELYNPRNFGTFEKICGIHGFRQNDYERVKAVKLRRGQYGNYDWELAERLESL